MSKRIAGFHLIALFSLLMNLASDVNADDEQVVSFRRDVAPILELKCVACHGAKLAEGGYRVDTFAELLKAGDSGALPIVEVTSEESGELLRRLQCTDPSERMPAEDEPLTDQQIAKIQQWLANGARYDGEEPDTPLHLLIPPQNFPAPPEVYAQPVPIFALAFSPDGEALLTGGYHELNVWDPGSGKLKKRIGNLDERVFAIQFLNDGKTLLAACGKPGVNGELRLFDFETGELKTVLGRSSDVVLDIALHPDGKQIALAAADGSIRIIDLETKLTTSTIASHADAVNAVAWNQDGSRLGSASRDKSSKVFDAATGQLLVSYLGHNTAVRGIVFSEDGKLVYSCGADQRLHRWDVENGNKVGDIAMTGDLFKLTTMPGGMFVPSADFNLRKIDAATNTIAVTFSGCKDWLQSASYNATKDVVAAGALDGEVRIWNAKDGALIHSWIAKP